MVLVETAPAPEPGIQVQRTGVRKWMGWRTAPGFGWADAIALALFFAMGAYALHFHEKWDDEAQAWLIARDNSVWQIIRHRLHYEGAPPLWHLLLHLFHLAGGPYAGIGWFGLGIATAGMYVWLRWSPLPAVLRLLLPFTFFFQYQYAVISRSYVLIPVLTFSLCALFRRRQKILLFAFCAGLLASVSLQGFALSVSLVALFIREHFGAELRRYVKHRQRIAWPSPARASAALFAIMACAAMYSAIPAPDLNFAIGDQVSNGIVHRILLHMIGETPRNAPKPKPEKPLTFTPVSESTPHWNTQPRAWLALQIYPRTAPRNHYALRWMFRRIGPPVLEFLDEASWPVANSNLLSCSFLIALFLWLRARRRLRMLLLWVGLLVVGQILWTAEHHAGMLLIALVAAVWLAADSGAADKPITRLDAIFLALFAAVLLGQIAWSAYSIRADVKSSYDPGPDTAQWLKERPRQRVAAFGFATVSIQPWFPRSPFIDVPTSWWQWSSNVEVDGIYRTVVATHPDVVVYGLEFPGTDPMRNQWLPLSHISFEEERTLPRDLIVHDLHRHGYTETHRFCGTRFARLGSAYRVCDIVFEPLR
jgi:hypothetical protein